MLKLQCLHLLGEGCEIIVMSMSIRLSARITQKPHSRTWRNFRYVASMSVALSSFGGVSDTVCFRFCGWRYVFENVMTACHVIQYDKHHNRDSYQILLNDKVSLRVRAGGEVCYLHWPCCWFVQLFLQQIHHKSNLWSFSILNFEPKTLQAVQLFISQHAHTLRIFHSHVWELYISGRDSASCDWTALVKDGGE